MTCGGTGIGPRDRTSDVVARHLAFEIPGIAEEIRRRGLEHAAPALVSREIAGIISPESGPRVFVLCAPGSRGGVRDAIVVVGPMLGYIVEQMDGNGHASGHSRTRCQPTVRAERLGCGGSGPVSGRQGLEGPDHRERPAWCFRGDMGSSGCWVRRRRVEAPVPGGPSFSPHRPTGRHATVGWLLRQLDTRTDVPDCETPADSCPLNEGCGLRSAWDKPGVPSTWSWTSSSSRLCPITGRRATPRRVRS